MKTTMLAVGDKFPGISSDIPPCSQLTWDQRGLWLKVIFNDISIKEFESKVQFKLVTVPESSAIFFMSLFDGKILLDSPYNLFCPPEECQIDPTTKIVPEGEGLALTMLLIEHGTNTIKQIRLLGLPHSLSCNLIRLVKRQVNIPWNGRVDYMQSIATVYAKYTPVDLWRRL